MRRKAIAMRVVGLALGLLCLAGAAGATLPFHLAATQACPVGGDPLAFTWRVICPAADCLSDSDCYCAGALSYSCVSYLCQYTYSGGGGGGGPFCPQMECTMDEQCVCHGRPGACNLTTGLCQF